MRIDLSGKTALVTASTAGIGFAIADGLAESGARILLNGRSASSVERAVAELRSRYPAASIEGIAADLATAEGATRLIQGAPQADILVNNVGIFEPRPFFDTTDTDWERHFQTNVMSGVRLSRHYLREMLARDWGRIVFISSESALNIPPDMIHYGMTKTAQLAIARGLAKLATGTAVTVNAVLPGPTLSQGVTDMLAGMDSRGSGTSGEAGGVEEPRGLEERGAAFVRAHRSSSILQRMAKPEEVANLVVYVCSPQASATTGAALRVDGGVVDSIL
jgi:NAD(P)-dependent dehydrogenase (short-subunit alcohol dehydrogenase family)